MRVFVVYILKELIFIRNEKFFCILRGVLVYFMVVL